MLRTPRKVPALPKTEVDEPTGWYLHVIVLRMAALFALLYGFDFPRPAR